MSLSAFSNFTAGWSATSQYIIDFQRGLVTHSKTLSKGQASRYLRTQSNVLRPDFNPRQANSYYGFYNIGQRYLLFLQNQANASLAKLSSQASLGYIFNHKDEFVKSIQTFAYPVAQYHGSGMIRTNYQRQLLVNYMKKITDKSYEYGMLPWQKKHKQIYKQKAINKLRQIAFKYRNTQQQTPVAADQE